MAGSVRSAGVVLTVLLKPVYFFFSPEFQTRRIENTTSSSVRGGKKKRITQSTRIFKMKEKKVCNRLKENL